MTDLDVDSIRKLFPSLARTVEGRPAVFADAPGGTQVPATVVEAIASYLRTSNANEGGSFITSEETGDVIVAARLGAGDFLGCDPGEIVFGPNMTTLAFTLSYSLARRLQPGDEVVVTRLDHDANIAPWLTAASDAGATVRWIDFDPADCTIELQSLDDALGERTRFVAFSLASNAVGTVTNTRAIIEKAHAVGAIAIADAVHFAPHRLIDVGALGADVLFCSPYKFFGPHMGVMFARRELLDSWVPWKVRPQDDVSPSRWEIGTRNHEALAGFSACIDYIATLGSVSGSRRERIVAAMQAIRRHEELLTRSFLEGIRAVDGIELYGIADSRRAAERTPTFALRLEGRTPGEVTKALAGEGVFAWDGNYYALEVMERLGLEDSGGAVRIGLCHYHSVAEVDYVLDCLRRL